MDILVLLRERGIDGDVDFRRENLQVLLEGTMDTEVSATGTSAAVLQSRSWATALNSATTPSILNFNALASHDPPLLRVSSRFRVGTVPDVAEVPQPLPVTWSKTCETEHI